MTAGKAQDDNESSRPQGREVGKVWILLALGIKIAPYALAGLVAYYWNFWLAVLGLLLFISIRRGWAGQWLQALKRSERVNRLLSRSFWGGGVKKIIDLLWNLVSSVGGRLVTIAGAGWNLLASLPVSFIKKVRGISVPKSIIRPEDVRTSQHETATPEKEVTTVLNENFRRKAFLIVCLLAGGVPIALAIQAVASGNWNALGKVLTIIMWIVAFAVPYFLKLVTLSLAYLWFPVIVYAAIALITTSKWLRFYLSLVALSIFMLVLMKTVLPSLSFTDVPSVLIYIMQVYILLLWTLPRELWNFLGAIVLTVKSAIVTLFANIPGPWDDLGIVLAIFAFIFLYIHTLASLLQRLIEGRLIIRMRTSILRLVGLPRKTSKTKLGEETGSGGLQ